MLSMGFKEDLNNNFKYNTGKRNTWLFSCYYANEIKRYYKTYMSLKAIRVEVNKKDVVNENISHYFIEHQCYRKS